MACKCIYEIEAELKERYAKNKDIEEVLGAKLQNTALMFSDGGAVKQELYSPVVIEHTYKNRKGEPKTKKSKANMAYKYCPFCGVPYNEEEAKK